MTPEELESRRVALKQTFDASFAEPRVEAPRGLISLLAIRLGDARFALPQGSVGGLERGLAVVPPPGRPAELCGVAGLRGGLLAVWDLAALIGVSGAGRESPWLVQCAAEPGAALAFSAFEGLHAVVPTALRPVTPPAAWWREVWDDGQGSLRPVLEVDRLLESIRRLAPERRNA